jgi:hypothetical protein
MIGDRTMAEEIKKIVFQVGAKRYEIPIGGSGSVPLEDSVGTKQIIDGGVEHRDLSQEALDKIVEMDEVSNIGVNVARQMVENAISRAENRPINND